MRVSTIANAFKVVKSPWTFLFKIALRVPQFIPDKLFLQLKYRSQMGVWPNFSNPKNFTEKINWLKLYNRRPEYTQMVDKYAVKKYVSSLIGEEYVIPLLGVWDNPNQIEWESLPSQFVLKTTHAGGSSGVIVCTDKSTFDRNNAISRLNKSLKSDVYLFYREWPYKDVPKRIIAEMYMSESGTLPSADLTDYKFFCFNGNPRYCQVIRDRQTKETIDFYDMSWKHMPFVGLNPKVSNGKVGVEKPGKLDLMIQLCKQLSSNMPFVRIDFYVINNKVYFGELTFFPASGIGKFVPEEWDYKLGEYLELPLYANI